jgi:tetratricopeptide (TPR) repeat protein
MAERTAREPELTEREALTHFERAVKENGDARAHFNLGSAYYAAHDLDNAFREFEQAVSLQPGLDHAHYYLGAIYKLRGDRENARKEFERVLNSSAHMMLKSQASIQMKGLNGK